MTTHLNRPASQPFMLNSAMLLNYLALTDDVWCEIVSYLNLKSIYNLEHTDTFFENLLQRTKFWERKLKRQFPDSDLECDTTNLKEKYHISRRMYWALYLQRHKCNICKLCFIENVCRKIPDCRKCNWLDMLD